MVGEITRVLAKHGQTHGDMEPVENVLGRRRDKFRQRTDLRATIGQEGDILVRLQTLALEARRIAGVWVSRHMYVPDRRSGLRALRGPTGRQ
jgi:hypothetical protein